ncbi:hypothetical protein [Streptococcus phage smHBZ8]|nr:hypothetical protein [Streptococcus phage smHBZ8]
MFKILIGDDIVCYQRNLRDALLDTIDFLTAQKHECVGAHVTLKNYTDEDLIEEIQSLTESRLTISVALKLDDNVSVVQEILE